MSRPSRILVALKLASLTLTSSLATAQTVTMTSPVDGRTVDIDDMGEVCVKFDYDWRSLALGPTNFHLYANASEVAITCDRVPNPLQWVGVDIQCCYTPAANQCAPVLTVKVHRCPDIDVYSQPVQPFLVDYDDPARGECVPAPPRCEQELAGGYRGKPVDVTNGNVYYEVEDVVIPIDIPIRLSRRWDSIRRDRLGDFGRGFRHSFEDDIECDAGGNVCTYTDVNDQSWTCGREPHHETFKCNAPFLLLDNGAYGYEYTIRFPDGSMRHFDTQTVRGETRLRLMRVVDSRSHNLNLVYLPDRVDVGGYYGPHSLVLHYSPGGGPIFSVQRSDGEVIEYDYTGDLLTSVRYPMNPTSDFQLHYDYDDASDPRLLTSVTDSAGHLLEAWDYEVVLGERRAVGYYEEDAGQGPVNQLAFAYSVGGMTVVTDALGASTTYFYTPTSQMLSSFVDGPNPNGLFPAGERTLLGQDNDRKSYPVIALVEGESVHRVFHPDPEEPAKWWNLVEQRVRSGPGAADESKVETCFDELLNAPLHIVVRTRDSATATCTPPPLPIAGVCPSRALLPGEMGIVNTIDAAGNVTRQAIHACRNGDPVAGPMILLRDFGYDGDERLETVTARYEGATAPRPVRIDYHPPTSLCCKAWPERLSVPVDASPANDLVTTFDLYDGLGGVIQSTDPNGVVTRFEYDFMGRVTHRFVDPLIGGEPVLETQYHYSDDHLGQLERVVTPEGREWNLEYDTAHRLTAVRDGAGNRSLTGYDVMSRVLSRSSEDALATLGWQMGYEPDEFSRIEAVEFETTAWPRPGTPTLSTVGLTYRQSGAIRDRTDPLGHFTALEYPSFSRRPSTARNYDKDPATGGVQHSSVGYVFDFLGAVDVLTDANALATTFDQNDLGEILSKVSSDGGAWTFTYDPAGNLETVVDGRGIAHDRSYDLAGRLTTITYPDATENVALSYDSPAVSYGRGRLTGVTGPSGSVALHYDREGRVVREVRTGLVAGTTEYGYDKDGSLVFITYPLSGVKVYYDRDVAGRVAAVRADLSPMMLNVPVARVMSQPPLNFDGGRCS